MITYIRYNKRFQYDQPEKCFIWCNIYYKPGERAHFEKQRSLVGDHNNITNANLTVGETWHTQKVGGVSAKWLGLVSSQKEFKKYGRTGRK